MSPVGPSIRAAVPADFSAVATLWREVEALHARLQPQAFRAPMPVTHQASFDRLCRGRSSTVLIAELDGAVAGFAALHLGQTPEDASFRPMLRLQVDMVGVDASVRRRGIGRALMEAAEKWGRERGASEIALTVWAGNEDAERFYQALGFRSLARALHKPL